MRFLSLFSGIEAASVAWKPLGWECVAVSEIEPFPCAVLKHHFPDVPNLGDVTKITETDIAALGQIDLVVFGSPCQDLSVAGKRVGFTGERSGLFYPAIDIIRWARKHGGCRFALWENVPGAFSSNQGRDFAAVVEEMAGLRDVAVPANGWGTEGVALGDYGLLEWSVLDAQWFGVAQRRRRVFAIVDFGSWENRRPILLERQSMRGDFAPSRETGQGFTHDIAPSLVSSGRSVERIGETRGQENAVFAIQHAQIGRKLSAGPQGKGWQEGVSFTMDSRPCADAVAYSVALRGRDGGAAAELGDEVGNTLRASGGCGDKPCVLTSAVAWSEELTAHTELAGTIQRGGSGGRHDGVMTPDMQVRRLLPTECEALQGFPYNWTMIPWRNKPAEECPDGHRYKALGNSMAVPVMRWIGQQIDSATKENKE